MEISRIENSETHLVERRLVFGCVFKGRRWSPRMVVDQQGSRGDCFDCISFCGCVYRRRGKNGKSSFFFFNFCPCLALLECGPNELHMFDRVHTLDQVHEFKNHIKQAKLHLLDPDYLWTQLEAISPLYKCTLRTMLFVHVHSLSPI